MSKQCPKCLAIHSNPGLYCSRSCANSRGPSKREMKECSCSSCKKPIFIGKRGTSTTALCEECFHVRRVQARGSKTLKCKVCGQSPCPKPSICQLYCAAFNHFGFDQTTLGSVKALEEIARIQVKLLDAYLTGASFSDIGLLADLNSFYRKNTRHVSTFLRFLGLSPRSVQESVRLATLQGKLEVKNPRANQQHCQAWHTTWDGRKVFLRSSYELCYAKQLDEQQIDYRVEALRIVYWDSQLLCQRIAIPDFYLPTTNTIIEIKANGSPWYDEQNMKDKEKAYREHGYAFELKLW